MTIDKVALYGAGLIGCGWATHLLCKGVSNIILFDLDDLKLEEAKKMVDRNLSFLLGEGVITNMQKDRYLSCLRFTSSVEEAVRDADLIQENGPENIDIKRSIIADIEKHCKDDAIIASSTSGILVNEIARDAKHPERIIGAHPYHPVYLLPLIEIVKGDRVEEKCVQAALDFYNKVDKKPVLLKKESPGYIASHLMQTLLRESVNLVLSGVCTLEDIDTAFTYGPGMRYALMGPHLVLQLAGGNSGIQGLLTGPIGKSSESWLKSLANWTEWPPEAREYFNSCQTQIDEIMSRRNENQGRTNAEMELYRDRGLVRLLQHHGML